MQMQFVVLSWQVYEITKDPLSLGLIGLAEAIPAVCFALYGGHVADRKDRRKIAIIAPLPGTARQAATPKISVAAICV